MNRSRWTALFFSIAFCFATVSHALPPAVKLAFATGEVEAPIGSCTRVDIYTASNMLVQTGVSKATKVTVDQGQGQVSFYSDSACTVKSAQFLLAQGANLGTFFISSTTVGSFTIRISADGLESALQMESFTQKTVSGGGPHSAPPTTAPAQAAAAGFSKLIFDDEFNSASTISPNGSGTFNWYTQGFFGSSASLPASGYSVQDGYLTINTDESGYSEGMSTASPSETSQVFQHGYFEASIHFDPKGHTSGAWPAFWSYSVENALGQVAAGTQYGEIDFLECYPVGSSCDYITTAHEWTKAASGGSDTSTQNSNNVPANNAPTVMKGVDYTQWHTYGCLWTPNQLKWYFDNQLVTTVATGPNTNFPAIEQDFMAVILGTGSKWPMDVDWVHVWQ